MKLIGRTENAGYLLDLSLIEMAHIMGFMNYTELKKSEEGKTLKIGDEIKLSDIYKQLKFYGTFGNELTQQALKLEELAKQLVLINPIVHVQENLDV